MLGAFLWRTKGGVGGGVLVRRLEELSAGAGEPDRLLAGDEVSPAAGWISAESRNVSAGKDDVEGRVRGNLGEFCVELLLVKFFI